MNIIIGFSKAKSLLAIGSTIISKIEHRDYSHVYIRNYDFETSLEMVHQASHGRVNAIAFENFKLNNIVVKEYKFSPTREQYVDIMRFMKSNLGVPYSRLQLILIGIKKLLRIEVKIKNGTSAEICSELGARVTKIAGIKIEDNMDFIAPSDLDKILKANNVLVVSL